MSRYEWDQEKARVNLAKHGVSFEEAETATDDDHARWFLDVSHSADEDRFFVFGPVERRPAPARGNVRGLTEPRIISAWRATKRERREYEER